MFGVPSPMTGKNHTDDVKRKLSEMRTGSGNTMYGKSGSLSPTSKKVIVDGIQYDSLTIAGEAIGVGRKTVALRIKSEKFPSYRYV
ncbi:NUMOD3 motif (2 copies) [compost metagenome]